MMLLEKSTIMVLRKFGEVNDHIVIPEGNVIKTRSNGSNSFLARATVKEHFERELPIYDLPQFNAIITMFEQPALKFGEDHVLVLEHGEAGASHMQKFKFANKSLLDVPTGFPPPREPEFTFQITEDDLKRIERGASVNRVDSVVLIKQNEQFAIQVCSVDRDSGDRVSDNVYYARREDVDGGGSFRSIIARSFLSPVLHLDYTVEIHAGAVHYIHMYNDWLEYWIAMSKGSTYTAD